MPSLEHPRDCTLCTVTFMICTTLSPRSRCFLLLCLALHIPSFCLPLHAPLQGCCPLPPRLIHPFMLASPSSPADAFVCAVPFTQFLSELASFLLPVCPRSPRLVNTYSFLFTWTKSYGFLPPPLHTSSLFVEERPRQAQPCHSTAGGTLKAQDCKTAAAQGTALYDVEQQMLLAERLPRTQSARG